MKVECPVVVVVEEGVDAVVAVAESAAELASAENCLDLFVYSQELIVQNGAEAPQSQMDGSAVG